MPRQAESRPDASGSVLGALLITILCGVALYLAERDPRRDAQVKRVAHALGAGWFAALALDVSLANGAALWVHAVAVARPGDVPGPDFVKYTFNGLGPASCGGRLSFGVRAAALLQLESAHYERRPCRARQTCGATTAARPTRRRTNYI